MDEKKRKAQLMQQKAPPGIPIHNPIAIYPRRENKTTTAPKKTQGYSFAHAI